MALNIPQQKAFRNWMIKSASVPILALLCFFCYWSWELGFSYFPLDRSVPFHQSAAALLLFGGFPLWNIVLEDNKLPLLMYHGLHFMASFGIFFYMAANPMVPPPSEFCLIIGAWCLAKEGLGFLMPETDKRVEGYVNWRRDTLEDIVKAHYYVETKE